MSAATMPAISGADISAGQGGRSATMGSENEGAPGAIAVAPERGQSLLGGHVMPDATCSIEGCEGQVKAKGWCYKHLRRWQRHGDPLITLRPGCDGWTVDRLRALKTRLTDAGCWEWTGNIDAAGYGRLGSTLAHRLVFTMERGPIPDGLTLDHLCRNRPCVNPDHLEPVTLAENKRRGNSPSEVNRRKTVCDRGHDLTDPANVYVCKRGKRNCRECRRIRRREGRG